MVKKLLLLTLSFFLISGIAFAEDPQVWPTSGQMTFKGLDTKSSPTQIGEGRAQDLQNVQFTVTGALKKRSGYSFAGTPSVTTDDILDIPDEDFPPVTGIYYNKFSDTNERIFATASTRLYYRSTAWTHILSPAITGGQNNQFVFVTALDYAIATNDVNPIIKVNSTPTASVLDLSDLLTDAPTKAKCVAWFQNHLILANTVENSIEKPTRIRWSDIGFIETFTEENRNDISELGGQEINALIELYDDLFIFLTNSVWKMSFVGGDEQFKFTKVLDKIGCIAKNSVQTIILNNSQRGIVFLTKNAEVYFFNGVTAVDISEIIEPTLEDWSASRLPYVVSEDTGEEYRIYGTTGSTDTTNNEVLVFNYSLGEWSRNVNIDVNCVARVVVSSAELSYAGNYFGMVLRLDNTANDSDVYGATGTVDSVNIYTTHTASGLQVLYDASASYTASGLIGAIVTLTGGTGSAQSTIEKTIVANTTTGIVIDSAYSTTPSTDTSFSVGAIDAYYQTKDYDLGDSTRIKNFGEIFMWEKEQGAIDLDVSYKHDFGGTVETQTVSESGGGGTWGSAIWGTSLWGGFNAIFSRVKLKGSSRFINIKFMEDDIDETFNIYGFNILYWMRKSL